MNQAFQDLKEFMKAFPDTANGAGNLLESRWQFHTVYYPVNSDAISEKLLELEGTLSPLSRKRKRYLLAQMLSLCTEYERAAFVSGIQVGAQLMLEMFEQDLKQKNRQQNSSGDETD